MSPTRTFAVLLAVVGLGCGAFAFRNTETPVHPVDRVSIATPLWSPRRVPQPIVDAVGGQRLQARLDSTLGQTQACVVVEEGGAPIASRTPDAALVPASTEKLLTGAVALAVLGPDTHLVTRAAAAKPVQGGVIDKLFMVGGGDFLLMTPEAQALRQEIPEFRGLPTTPLADLADRIVAAGVKRIPGGIVGDDSRYEQVRYLPTWKDSYRTEGQVGPLGALTVNGGFAALRPEPVPVDDPAVFAASELGRLLEARGVSVGRDASRGTAPAGAVDVAKVESPPMSSLVGEVLAASDNLGAELLTREIGLQVSKQGTTSAGTQAILAELTKLELPTGTITLVDGSGLDRGNRVSCNLLDAVLDLGADKRFGALWSGLAVAGQSGTLINQLDGSPLDGKLRGKTGSLDGVTGLVGIIELGRSLRFAFLANGTFTEVDGVRLRALIASIIATFPDAPPADVLVPAPAGGARANAP